MNWGCRWGGGEERENQILKVQLKDTFKICIFVQGYKSTLPDTNSVLGYKSHPYTNSVQGYKSTHSYTQLSARIQISSLHPSPSHAISNASSKKSSTIYNIMNYVVIRSSYSFLSTSPSIIIGKRPGKNSIFKSCLHLQEFSTKP